VGVVQKTLPLNGIERRERDPGLVGEGIGLEEKAAQTVDPVAKAAAGFRRREVACRDHRSAPGETIPLWKPAMRQPSAP
jgi:hypothetical protein